MKLLSREEMELLGVRLKELKKSLPRIPYTTFIDSVKDVEVKRPYLVNIRGANGTGKSTVPLLITLTDPDVMLITGEGELEGKEILTYSPMYNLAIMGRYYTKTGGLDISLYQDKQRIAKVLTDVWHDTRLNILMEGIVCSSSYGFYADLFKDLEAVNPVSREVMILNLVMELDDLEKRIMARNGGRKIKMHYVEGKQATVKRNIPKFARDGFNSWVTNNRDVPYEGMVEWFMEELKANRSVANI